MARAERPKRYTATLPPVKVTPAMKATLVEFAARYGLSVSDVVREAVEAYQERGFGLE